MHRFLRRLGKTLAALLAVLLAYLLAAFTLGSIVLTPERHGRRDITLYLLDNGVHTDLALPLANDTYDWTTFIRPEDARDTAFAPAYVAFGWGDRAFYLETPHWRDLKPRPPGTPSADKARPSSMRPSYRRCAKPRTASPFPSAATNIRRSLPASATASAGATTVAPSLSAAVLTATTTLSTKRAAATACSLPATPGRMRA